MIDNPKAFIIIAMAFLVSVSVILYATNSYVGEQESLNTFEISVNKGSETTSTTKTTSSTTKKPTTATTNTVTKPTNQYNAITPTSKSDYTVRYTSAGFVPQTQNVIAGKSVRFINESSGGSMFIVTARSPNANDITEFNQGSSVGKGGYYDFTFNKKGVYVYYNQNDRTKTGVIVVE